MKPFSRAMALSGLCLTMFATSPSAEGAWVLWYGETTTDTWIREDAFDARTACLKTLDRNEQFYGKTRAQRASETVLVVLPAPGVSGTGFRLDCLPDTMDPRGPKGK